MQVEFGKWGNSIGVRIPSVLLKQLGLTAGSSASLEVKNGGLFLMPARGRYTLEEMIASLPTEPEGEIDFGQETGNETVEWE